MRITFLKSTVEAALASIFKLFSAAKRPDDSHPTLTI